MGSSSGRDGTTSGRPHHGGFNVLHTLNVLKHAALHTSPSFFSITMGTGITSILLHNFPYPARWLRVAGNVVFVLNVVIFVLLSLASLFRYTFWPGTFGATLKHKIASMFWGTVPMGLATIVSMVCYTCVPAWGERWAYVALGLWWADVALTAVVHFGMVVVLFTRQKHTPRTILPSLLLPIVTSVVVAATGAVVAQSLRSFSPHLGRSTLIATYCVWGTGVPLAMMVIALLVQRMAVYGPPHLKSIAMMFLPLGPCGQGSFGILQMGICARDLAYQDGVALAKTGSEGTYQIGDAVYAGGIVVSLILWGLGLLWYSVASIIFVDAVRRDVSTLRPEKFRVGLWGLTFPIGTLAAASNTLAIELGSPAFRVIGAFLSTQVILNWTYVSVMTVWQVLDGKLFSSPELVDKGDDDDDEFLAMDDGDHSIAKSTVGSQPNETNSSISHPSSSS